MAFEKALGTLLDMMGLRIYRPAREVCWDLDPGRRAFYAERQANLQG